MWAFAVVQSDLRCKPVHWFPQNIGSGEDEERARFSDASELRNILCRPRNMLECLVGEDRIETPVSKWQRKILEYMNISSNALAYEFLLREFLKQRRHRDECEACSRIFFVEIGRALCGAAIDIQNIPRRKREERSAIEKAPEVGIRLRVDSPTIDPMELKIKLAQFTAIINKQL